jgi:hypothetical protein
VTGALTLLFAFGALELRSIREQVSELKAFDKRLQEMSGSVPFPVEIDFSANMRAGSMLACS